MGLRFKIFAVCMLLLTTVMAVSAIQFKPSGNIEMQGFNISNGTLFQGVHSTFTGVSTFSNIRTVNTTLNNGGYIIIEGGNISFYNKTGVLKSMISVDTVYDITAFTNSINVAAVISQNDIYTSGTGDDLWLGTATTTASKAILYADGTLKLNTSTYTACTKANAGAIIYNNSNFIHYGCNSTLWRALY